MKKIFTTLAVAAIALSASADFSQMEFRLSDGEAITLPAEDLVMNPSGDSMSISYQGQTTPLSLPLTSLVEMEFKDNLSAVGSVISPYGPMEFFSLDGVLLGSFTSCSEASSALPDGIYIVRNADASTFKLKIAK